MINYLLLMKPGIVLGNLITVAAGFLLASNGVIDLKLFFTTLIGLAFIMASGCVFNNYIDQPLDAKMERTQNRPLITGLITGPSAIAFATILVLIGNFVLFFYTNLLATLIADGGFFVYVVLYSLWKSKTIYGTAIGSVAGAVPPVVGYCAVSNEFDLGAFILFAMLVFWQMPHFFSIAIFHMKDYAAAKIPVLPIERGMLRTKIQMIAYIICFIATAGLLTLFNYTGYLYLVVVTSLGLAWLGLGIKGFSEKNNEEWGRNMFRLSLVLIMGLCLVLPFDLIT